MHTYIHTYIHTCIYTCVPTSMHIHTYMHTYIHTCIHTCIHTYMHAGIHECIHAYLHTCIHAYMHAYMQEHTRHAKQRCHAKLCRESKLRQPYEHTSCSKAAAEESRRNSGKTIAVRSPFASQRAPPPCGLPIEFGRNGPADSNHVQRGRDRQC